MIQTDKVIETYINYCSLQKRLDEKTIKAYKIDLSQFTNDMKNISLDQISPQNLENYIEKLNSNYKPKTVKRKIASIKAFFRYLEYKEIIDVNPFNKLQIHFREPVILPKTIPLYTMEQLLSTIYQQQNTAHTCYQKRNALRDAAVTEFLFATGIRISELCNLSKSDVNIHEGTILIYGKGDKERRIQIGNPEVLELLKGYKTEFADEIEQCGRFFANQFGKALSDQSVRRMIKKYTKLAAIEQHITPHMFRHTFATSLLEADVDIRYIQEMLGHSSINVTEIYTHVAIAKQRDILTNKHPRRNMKIG